MINYHPANINHIQKLYNVTLVETHKTKT